MYAELASAIQSIKTIGEIAKASTSLTNYNELASAVSEVNMKLMEAMAVALESQEKQSSLLRQISELQDEIRKLKELNSRVERYKLHEFSTGTLAYALKEECNNGEPMHYLCTTCVDKGLFTRLQPTDGKRILFCPECNMKLGIKSAPPRPSHTSSKPFLR